MSQGAGFLRLFMSLKWRLGNNHLSGLRQHLWIHFVVAMMVLAMIVGGGSILFNFIFRGLQNQQPFGPALVTLLVKMVLLAFFSMLIFSNLIIMLTTTYISREVEFLMSLPVGHRSLFFGKLAESVVYSSWAFVILSFPFFSALGRSRELGWTYYGGLVVLAVPYLIIPAAAGAAGALLITAFLSPRRIIRFSLTLAALGVAGAVIMRYTYGLPDFLRGATEQDLAQLVRFMNVGDWLGLPSGWLGRGMTALEQGQWREAGVWAAALWSTAAMGLVTCDALAGPLYYRGWCLARSSGNVRKVGNGGGLYRWLNRLLAPLPASTRAMISKDLTIFWRDPAQWGQLCMLFGLLSIYFVNLRSAAGMGRYQIFIPLWQSLISLFNIGATGFVLSILTTRFVFPMLSLEGRQQWVIGLAPVGRTRLVWEKFLLSTAGSLVVTVPLVLLSCYMLRAEAFIYGMGLVTVVVLSPVLSALAVGMGALLPNFGEDNPSRIANGLGGTLTAILSMFYVMLTLTLEGPWVYAYVRGFSTLNGRWWALLWTSAAVWGVLHAAAMSVPLWLGLRHWRRIEF